MLGRLARWLRVLGFDTHYDETLSDPSLVRLAAQEDRLLLTRDRHLLRELRPAAALEIRHDDPLDQLRDLVERLSLPAPAELFTRCILCNCELAAPLAPELALELLPPGVRGIPGPVRQCPACQRIYWHGSHVRRMRVALDRTLPGWLD
jgi:uncharacterized protein with PIN domain